MPDLPANSTTPASINPMSIYSGRLEQPGDRDWIRLIAGVGETIQVSVIGETIEFSDTVLRIFNGAGDEVAFNDDGQEGPGSELRFTIAEDGPYYIEVGSFEDRFSGDYVVAVAPSIQADPLDALDWGTAVRDPDINVYFAEPGQTFDGYTSEGFNAYERARFEAAFDLIEAVTNVSFTVVNSRNEADFRLVLDLDEDTEDFQAFFNPPRTSGAGVGVFDGNQWDRAPGGDLQAGGYSFAVITHELLHGLGMAHPHDFGGDSLPMDGVYYDTDDYGPYDLNQGIFTTMSYNQGFYSGTPGSRADDDFRYGSEIGPMALDIAVLQRKYGVNTTTGTGDTVYTLPTVNQGGTGWRAIWDVTGVDEIRADPNDTTGVIINLKAATLQNDFGGGGFYSGETGIAGGFTVANGVVIENATGARGNDQIFGNAAANRLDGRGGDDRLYAGLGGDTLFGGGGYDRAIVEFDLWDILSINDSLATTPGVYFLSVAAADGRDVHTVQMSGIEWVTFENGSGRSMADLIALETGEGIRVDGAGQVTGGALNDTVVGGTGRDVIDGRGGADLMVGRGGNDFYFVDNPLDVVREDADFSAGGGIDTVRAFVDYIQPENVELVRLANIDDVLHLDATGNDAPGTLVGNAGRNVLTGRGGNDQINGNAGDDTLIGNTGRDTLVGGQGADTFVYTSISESRAGAANRDVINGFENFAGDVIDLRGIDADTTSFGVDDAFTFINTTRFSGTAGELRLQGLGEANAVLVEGDINGDSTADFQIFVNLTIFLASGDFLL